MEDVPEVEHATRVWANRGAIFKVGDGDGIRVGGMTYADANFFDVSVSSFSSSSSKSMNPPA